MRSLAAAVAALAVLGVAAPVGAATSAVLHRRGVWPAQGQAAYVIGAGPLHASPDTHRAAIASIAKVMTAHLVLRAFPLAGGQSGFTMTVHAPDVADWQRRVDRGESTVPVRLGERLTERKALLALMLPSANNVAIMLARRVGGSVAHFVHRMNRRAGQLGMHHTGYTDPSGFDADTTSTPTDQVRLANEAMTDPFFRWLVSRRQARIPVAGVVQNYNTLLGTGGFVGIKTGSMSASGGCLVFRAQRWIGGHRVWITGIVLGQYGPDLIQAGLAAARRLVNRVDARGW